MINSWTALIYSLDEMRVLQKNPGSKKIPALTLKLAQLERDVDECIASKIAEFKAKEQPELPGVTHG